MGHLAQDLDPTPVTDLEIPSEVLHFKTKSRKTSCLLLGLAGSARCEKCWLRSAAWGGPVLGWLVLLPAALPGDADVPCLLPKRGFGRLDKELLGE